MHACRCPARLCCDCRTCFFFSDRFIVRACPEQTTQPNNATNAPVVFFVLFLHTISSQPRRLFLSALLLQTLKLTIILYATLLFTYHHSSITAVILERTSKSRMIVVRSLFDRVSTYGHRFLSRVLLALVSGRPISAPRTELAPPPHLMPGTNYPPSCCACTGVYLR